MICKWVENDCEATRKRVENGSKIIIENDS